MSEQQQQDHSGKTEKAAASLPNQPQEPDLKRDNSMDTDTLARKERLAMRAQKRRCGLTNADIARLAGVSTATVASAMIHDGRASSHMRARILGALARQTQR